MYSRSSDSALALTEPSSHSPKLRNLKSRILDRFSIPVDLVKYHFERLICRFCEHRANIVGLYRSDDSRRRLLGWCRKFMILRNGGAGSYDRGGRLDLVEPARRDGDGEEFGGRTRDGPVGRLVPHVGSVTG